VTRPKIRRLAIRPAIRVRLLGTGPLCHARKLDLGPVGEQQHCGPGARRLALDRVTAEAAERKLVGADAETVDDISAATLARDELQDVGRPVAELNIGGAGAERQRQCTLAAGDA